MLQELLKDVFPLIQKSAPTIASALGSPALGIPAMWALSLIGNKFGIDVQHTDPQELVKVMTSDPQCTDKLCQLENHFAEWFKGSEIKISEAEVNIKIKFSNG